MFWTTHSATAQELEPQRWRHLPVDSNFLSIANLYTDAQIVVDPALRIERATMSLNTTALGYARTFELFGKSAQVQFLQPWQDGEWKGTIDGVQTSVARQGLADTQLRFAVHLLGAPPLEGIDYVQYRARMRVETLLGLALGIQLPTGEYKNDKLINLGTNQFTFRPEIGFVHGRGNWSFEASGIVSLYTANDSFAGGRRLERDPSWLVQSSLLYRVRSDFWLTAGAAYTVGGPSTVDGVASGDRKEHILWGFGAGYAITPSLGMRLQYIRSDRLSDTGMDSDRYVISITGSW